MFFPLAQNAHLWVLLPPLPYIIFTLVKEMETYGPAQKMRELIADNRWLLMLMSRCGIPMGFGEKTVAETCAAAGVECGTFLALANFMAGKPHDASQVQLPALVSYLKRAHSYFLEFNFPNIRRRLIEALDYSGTNDIALAIVRYFDEYVAEVRQHMEHEERRVFTYVEGLLRGTREEGYDIATFAQRHNHIDSKLRELTDIIVQHCPERPNDLMNAALFDIMNCQQDLDSHCSVEDAIFVPAVEKLEHETVTTTAAEPHEEERGEREGCPLSDREKDVVAAVARGLSNKEIAERLFLSVNTVTTHRRNIARKLHIHTPNGLTIYALVNKLVEINDIGKVE